MTCKQNLNMNKIYFSESFSICSIILSSMFIRKQVGVQRGGGSAKFKKKKIHFTKKDSWSYQPGKGCLWWGKLGAEDCWIESHEGDADAFSSIWDFKGGAVPDKAIGDDPVVGSPSEEPSVDEYIGVPVGISPFVMDSRGSPIKNSLHYSAMNYSLQQWKFLSKVLPSRVESPVSADPFAAPNSDWLIELSSLFNKLKQRKIWV